jgi:hypothetical protein
MRKSIRWILFALTADNWQRDKLTDKDKIEAVRMRNPWIYCVMSEWWCCVSFKSIYEDISLLYIKILRERQKLFFWIVQRSDQLWHHVSCSLDEKNISSRDILWSVFDFHHFSFILEKNDLCRIRIFKYFFFEIICRSITVWNL